MVAKNKVKKIFTKKIFMHLPVLGSFFPLNRSLILYKPSIFEIVAARPCKLVSHFTGEITMTNVSQKIINLQNYLDTKGNAEEHLAKQRALSVSLI